MVTKRNYKKIKHTQEKIGERREKLLLEAPGARLPPEPLRYKRENSE